MFPLISSLTGANAVDPRTSRKGKILEHDERNGLVGIPLSASSWMFSKRDFAAVKKVSSSSFISSEFKLDDWESSELRDDSMNGDLSFKLELLLPTPLACACLPSL